MAHIVPRQLSVSRQLILDVVEPYIKEEIVHAPSSRKNTFSLFKFGTFNLEDDTYIYGTEKKQYKYSNEHFEKKLPIVIAQLNHIGKRRYYELVPIGNFTDKEIDVISDSISYTLESQRVASKYFAQHC